MSNATEQQKEQEQIREEFKIPEEDIRQENLVIPLCVFAIALLLSLLIYISR